jgi:16S rRNA (cytidine1402-2'-O)-methyltransferase
MTLLIGKAKEGSDASDLPLEDAVRELEGQGLSRMDAIKQVAKARGMGKRDVYAALTAPRG